MSLWKGFHFYQHITSPQLRIYKLHFRTKETSFCACPKARAHKASLTIEAAVVLPVMSAFFVFLLSFFHILHIQMKVEEALTYAGRKVAVESSVVEEELALFASAQGLVLWEIGRDNWVARYVSGGGLGVSLLGSSFQDDQIILHATYKIELPLQIFGVDGIMMWSRQAFQKWVGDMPDAEDEEEECWVYVTPQGEVYHRLESCRALVIRLKSAFLWTIETIRGKNGQKYYPCSRCVANISENDVVYYTDYGELYHQSLSCSHIKRTIEKMLLSEVEERRPCSLCCGGDE